MAVEPISTIKSVTGNEISVYDKNYDNSQMDQEGFLKVLLKNFEFQDPFETQDIAEFIDNTVKLRELEVLQNFEESVQQLAANDTLFLNATNLIGKSVLYKGESVGIENGIGHVEFVPKEDVESATIYIYDQDNQVVAEKNYVNVRAGTRYSFDLSDENIPDGNYKVSIVTSSGDNTVQSDVYATAKVEGVQKEGGSIVALIGGQEIKISDIVGIGG